MGIRISAPAGAELQSLPCVKGGQAVEKACHSEPSPQTGRGNPFPAPAGAESPKPPSVREVSRPLAVTEGEIKERRAGQSPAPTSKKRRPFGRRFSASINLSCHSEEHPKGTCFAARSDYFRAARRHKNNDMISGCRKSRRLFRQPEAPPLRAALQTICRLQLQIALHQHL